MIWSAISTDSCEIHKHEIDRKIKMLPSSNKYGSQWIIEDDLDIRGKTIFVPILSI